METAPRIVLLIVAAALAGLLQAQGRHDERRHGTAKAPDTPISEPKIHPGGRHDEQSHKAAIAVKKKTAKKAAEPKADETKAAGAKSSDANANTETAPATR